MAAIGNILLWRAKALKRCHALYKTQEGNFTEDFSRLVWIILLIIQQRFYSTFFNAFNFFNKKRVF